MSDKSEITKRAGIAAPGGSAMPAMNYKNKARGTGSGAEIEGTGAEAIAPPKSRKAIEKEMYGTGILGEALAPDRKGELNKRFAVPPFTIINAREGWYQDRKRVWLSLGIRSELGRGADVGEAPSPVPKASGSIELAQEKPAISATPKASKPQAQPREKKASIAKPAARRPMSMPSIEVEGEEEEADKRPRLPMPSPLKAIEEQYGAEIIDFGPWNPEPGSGGAVGLDVECYPNCFIVNLKRFGNGEKLSFEMSNRSEIDFKRLLYILSTECIITFNGNSYDIPIIYLAAKGADTYALKEATNRLMGGGIKFWEVEKQLGITIPKINHVDLMEPNPGVRVSLKMLAAHLHAKTIMNLPYKPDKRLTREEMNVLCIYCFHDIDDTELLFKNLREPLTLRVALGKEYGIDLRSKSDAQVGEAIVKKRAEKILGRRVKKLDLQIEFVPYKSPPFIKFETEEMKGLLAQFNSSEFTIDGHSKVVMPEWLKKKKIVLGETEYSIGIGGLHSTEANRAIHADEDYFLLDIDVSSQYPIILLLLGLEPKALIGAFLQVYKAIIDERINAKKRLKEIKELLAQGVNDNEDLLKEQGQVQQKSEGGKIQVNGVYGKLGSLYSFLFSPEMLIATTITGQLSLLMMIERVVARGISVVSANTDGLIFRCARSRAGELDEIIAAWEKEVGFEIERTYYKSIYSSSVNSYFAVKDDGKFKVKGPRADHWSAGAIREMMQKNPQMTVLTKAIIEFIKNGTSFEETIRGCSDVRMFLTCNNVKEGAQWRGAPLGKVVRYYWSTDGDPILYVNSGRKVANTAGAKPLMTLSDELPSDVDFEKYIAEATEVAYDIALLERPALFNGRKKK